MRGHKESRMTHTRKHLFHKMWRLDWSTYSASAAPRVLIMLNVISLNFIAVQPNVLCSTIRAWKHVDPSLIRHSLCYWMTPSDTQHDYVCVIVKIAGINRNRRPNMVSASFGTYWSTTLSDERGDRCRDINEILPVGNLGATFAGAILHYIMKAKTVRPRGLKFMRSTKLIAGTRKVESRFHSKLISYSYSIPLEHHIWTKSQARLFNNQVRIRESSERTNASAR